MSTGIKFSEDAREALKRGVDLVANPVKASLGAEGRNVIIPANNGGYMITKDGVSIARSIYPEDQFEAIGASLIKESATRTNSEAGDGTTTATVIAQAIFDEGLKLIDAGESSVELKKGIDTAAEDVVKHLKDISRKVTKKNLKHVATVSANGDEELGEMISKAFNKIGKHGSVLTAISDTAETDIELREGVVLDKGYTSRIFRTDTQRDICKLDNPFVLLHRGKIEKGDNIVKIFDAVFTKPDGRILIITDDIDPFVHSVIAQNIDSGAIKNKICVVTLPQILRIQVDLLNDLATLTGATIVSSEKGTKIEARNLGKIKSCVVSETDTVIVGDANNLTDLTKEIEEKIEITKNRFDKEELQERLARITGGVATIRIGAKSDSELAEKSDRVEDSINATKSALEEGIVSGGGVALRNIADMLLEDFKAGSVSSFSKGYELLLKSCTSPFNQILKNAGMETVEKMEDGFGIDVKTGKMVPMMLRGIIDPTKVTRCALENAASVASTFLTTEAIVARVQQ
jgi:chaperonin GroEL